MSLSGGGLYTDALGNQVAHDGASPVTWRLASYALAVRDGTSLLVEPVWAERLSPLGPVRLSRHGGRRTRP